MERRDLYLSSNSITLITLRIMKGIEHGTCTGDIDRQCTCNVIFKYVRVTILTVEVQ